MTKKKQTNVLKKKCSSATSAYKIERLIIDNLLQCQFIKESA